MLKNVDSIEKADFFPKLIKVHPISPALIEVIHSLIRGVLIQSCSTGAKNFTNYVFFHPQFSDVIQNIENRCAIRAKF